MRNELYTSIRTGDKDLIKSAFEKIEQRWFDVDRRSGIEVVMIPTLTEWRSLYDEACDYMVKLRIPTTNPL